MENKKIRKKQCKNCGKNKNINRFYFSVGRYRHPCKECTKNKRYSIKGTLYQRWRGIVQRCTGQVNHFHTAIGKEYLSKEKFFKWALSDGNFIKLYNYWKKKNFKRDLAPSIDRIDITKGYVLNNIQWITMGENNSKKENDWKKAFGKTFQKSKKVRLWKNTGEEIFFNSGKEASKYFGKNRLATTDSILKNHKLNGWNCEWIKFNEGICECGHRSKDHSYEFSDINKLECDKCDCENYKFKKFK